MTNKQQSHVLIVDHVEGRRQTIAQLFAGHPVTVHQAANRTDTLGKIWDLASDGITPRAIITNWLLDDDAARDFFKLIGREVDHTSLNLIRNVIKIDRANPGSPETLLICYCVGLKHAAEALVELQSEGLKERVGVALYHPLTGLNELGQAVCDNSDAGTLRLLSAITQETSDKIDRAMDDGSNLGNTNSSPADNKASSGALAAIRRLSR